MSAIALDPLIAEAKERARRRRFVALGVVALAAAAAIGTVLATRSSPREPALSLDAASRSQLPIVVVDDSGGGVIDALSADGGFWLTKDGGQTWLQAPAADVPPDPDFVDRRHGWIVARNPFSLERTTDGGRTWQRLSLPGYTPVGHGSHYSMGPFVDGLSFASPTTGFVAVEPFNTLRQELFATTDGGSTWQPRVLPAEATLLQFVDARRGYAEGRGIFYSTADGGRTWRVILRSRSFVPVGLVGRTLVWSKATDPPSLYVTRDGGATWSSRHAPLGSLHVVNQHTWVVTSSSRVFVTTSAGRRWRSVQLGVPAGWKAVQVGPFTSIRTGWAIFTRGSAKGKKQLTCVLPACVLARTTDGGRHWTPAGPPKPKGPKRG